MAAFVRLRGTNKYKHEAGTFYTHPLYYQLSRCICEGMSRTVLTSTTSTISTTSTTFLTISTTSFTTSTISTTSTTTSILAVTCSCRCICVGMSRTRFWFYSGNRNMAKLSQEHLAHFTTANTTITKTNQIM